MRMVWWGREDDVLGKRGWCGVNITINGDYKRLY